MDNIDHIDESTPFSRLIPWFEEFEKAGNRNVKDFNENRSLHGGVEAARFFLQRINKEIDEEISNGKGGAEININFFTQQHLFTEIQSFSEDLTYCLNAGRTYGVKDLKFWMKDLKAVNKLQLLIEFGEVEKPHPQEDRSGMNTADDGITEDFSLEVEKSHPQEDRSGTNTADDGITEDFSLMGEDAKPSILKRIFDITGRTKKEIAMYALLALGTVIAGYSVAGLYQGRKDEPAPQKTRIPEVAPKATQTPAKEQIYCEVYREPTGYGAACKETEKPKLSALEDIDKTDDLVPVQIDVEQNGINYACKAVIKKTLPNADGSTKTILAEDLNCEKAE